MSEIVVFNSISLDGVMQAPGRPDEDTRGGFRHGGWAAPYADAVLGEVAAASMAATEALILGRRTYEDLNGFWPRQTDNPFTEVLNGTRQYVASRTLQEPLPWRNSVLLGSDVPAAVAELRQQPGGDLVVLGSGDLLQTLIAHDLVDRYVLLIHPLVLGSGRRMFPDAVVRPLQLVESRPTTTGVVVATYRRAVS